MAEKKERGRFSIKFNENDPSHAAVIELLEKQGPHSKAQFIVNAILHYVHYTEVPDIHPTQVVDKAASTPETVDASMMALIVDTMLSFRGQ